MGILLLILRQNLLPFAFELLTHQALKAVVGVFVHIDHIRSTLNKVGTEGV